MISLFAHAGAVPELHRVAEAQAFVVPTTKTESRDRDIQTLIETEFVRSDPVGSRTPVVAIAFVQTADDLFRY